MKKFENYTYYKGEGKCPFAANSGKSVWWAIESYAAKSEDAKNPGTLSETMTNYIRERHWLGDSSPTTSWEQALARSQELYNKGLWSSSYIANKATTIDSAY